METLEEPPPAGAYLSDGRRLAEVVGVDVEGKFHLADCSGDLGSEADIVLTLEEVLTWKQVVPGA